MYKLLVKKFGKDITRMILPFVINYKAQEHVRSMLNRVMTHSISRGPDRYAFLNLHRYMDDTEHAIFSFAISRKGYNLCNVLEAIRERMNYIDEILEDGGTANVRLVRVAT
jgi:hypothetical protein